MMNTARLGQGLTANHVSPRSHSAAEESCARDVITSGDFRIDLAARCATLRGENLRLSSEEFEVLVYLVNHHQGLVTPHTMLATRWTRASVRQIEFLRVLLGLMKKVEAVGGSAQHYLRTESWVAFRFEPAATIGS